SITVNLGNGTNGFIAVSAIDECNVGVEQWNQMNLEATPQVPTALPADNVTPGQFNANWNTVQFGNDYQIDVATDNTFNNTVSGSPFSPCSNTSYMTISGLSCNIPYYY